MSDLETDAMTTAAISPEGSTPTAVETLSLLDKLSFIWRIPLLALRCISYFASMSLARGEISKLNWRQKLPLAFLRASINSLTEEQRAVQLRWPLTGPRIETYCRKKGLEHERVLLSGSTVLLDDGRHVPAPALHFVTPSESQKSGPTIFYFHGGGYSNAIQPGAHIPFVLLCATACGASQIAFLEYSLSPEWRYPCQLIQAVQGLRFLLEEKRIEARDLILGGDSAGGHLAAGLLMHVVHPSPYAAPIHPGNEQFKAVMFISPWLTMSGSQPHDLSAPYDYLTQERSTQFAHRFNPALDEIWANPLQVDGAATIWQKAFPVQPGRAICRKAIVVAGSSELLMPSCFSFGKDLVGCKSIRINNGADLDPVKESAYVLAIGAGETHVQPALDCSMHYHQGWMTRATLAFLETL